jgi:hypothetical protein
MRQPPVQFDRIAPRVAAERESYARVGQRL